MFKFHINLTSVFCIKNIIVFVFIKNIKPETAMLLSIAVGIIIIMNSVSVLSEIVKEINNMAEYIGVEKKYIVLLFMKLQKKRCKALLKPHVK